MEEGPGYRFVCIRDPSFRAALIYGIKKPARKITKGIVTIDRTVVKEKTSEAYV